MIKSTESLRVPLETIISSDFNFHSGSWAIMKSLHTTAITSMLSELVTWPLWVIRTASVLVAGFKKYVYQP